MTGSKTLLVLIVTLLLAGCDSPNSSVDPTKESPELVTIRTDQDRYSPNDEITIIIRNGMGEAIEYYGSCSLTLCQFTDGDWMCAVKDCSGPRVVLPSGETSRLVDRIDSSTGGPLRYQFEYFVLSSDSLRTIQSNEFIVEP